MNISVIGLGKLGSPLAAVLAAKGHRVIGVDVQPSVVQALSQGRAPVYEPGLQEMLQAAGGRLSATTDTAAAVAASEVTFIIVPTPSDEHGRFSLRYVLPAAKAIGEALRAKPGRHLVVITSTVMPGSTQGQIQPVLEEHSGKKAGIDFGLCYNPEFIALGSVIRDMLHPDFLLIGESDPQSGQALADLYQGVCENRPAVARMNFVNAELAKISVNTFVTTKISYANMLARVCERLAGADVDVVTRAIGMDSRIGGKYLKGAVGYGGPCFPRDNVAFARLARDVDAPALLAEATDALNRRQVDILADLVQSRLPQGGCAVVLGLSYKPDTDVCEASPGVDLALSLARRGVKVLAYDPAAMPSARKVAGDQVVFAADLPEAVRQADVLVVSVPWPAFKTLDPALLRRSGRRAVVIDCWRMLDQAALQAVADYVALGRGV